MEIDYRGKERKREKTDSQKKSVFPCPPRAREKSYMISDVLICEEKKIKTRSGYVPGDTKERKEEKGIKELQGTPKLPLFEKKGGKKSAKCSNASWRGGPPSSSLLA